jgi:hypothetical protein
MGRRSNENACGVGMADTWISPEAESDAYHGGVHGVNDNDNDGRSGSKEAITLRDSGMHDFFSSFLVPLLIACVPSRLDFYHKLPPADYASATH